MLKRSARIWQFVIVAFYFGVASIPGIIFFLDGGGLLLLQAKDGQSFCANSYPLFGLYAFFLVWAQIIIGASMPALRKVFPHVEMFHRAEGCLALACALLHAILLPVSTGASNYFNYTFVAPDQKIFAILGQVQLAAMLLTVTTALLWRLAMLRSAWLYIHYLNYAIFLAIWIHSWNLGSDLQQSNYAKWLWIFYGVTVAAAFILRLAHALRKPAKATATDEDSMFVAVSKIADISPDKPKCANSSGSKLALFNVNGEFFAIDNVCSHAGGSLCEGRLEGTAVICPRHSAKFDVRTGAVVKGPARLPQESYTTRIKGDSLEVKLAPRTTSIESP